MPDNSLQTNFGIARIRRMPGGIIRSISCGFGSLCLLFVTVGWAQNTPPLTTEIGVDRPLFIFAAPVGDDPAAYAQGVVDMWTRLPENLKPFSVIHIGTKAP